MTNTTIIERIRNLRAKAGDSVNLNRPVEGGSASTNAIR